MPYIKTKFFNFGDLYKDAIEFEKAMNLCEIQQFQYLKIFLTKVNDSKLIDAMKLKDWEKVSELYNGKNWKKTNPEYANNLKKYYDEYTE